MTLVFFVSPVFKEFSSRIPICTRIEFQPCNWLFPIRNSELFCLDSTGINWKLWTILQSWLCFHIIELLHGNLRWTSILSKLEKKYISKKQEYPCWILMVTSGHSQPLLKLLSYVCSELLRCTNVDARPFSLVFFEHCYIQRNQPRISVTWIRWLWSSKFVSQYSSSLPMFLDDFFSIFWSFSLTVEIMNCSCWLELGNPLMNVAFQSVVVEVKLSPKFSS